MVTAIQRDSGYPIMFRAVPGNIVDVTTLSTTITTLAEYDVQTDLAMLDAGYVSLENMKSLFSAGIEFVARLPEKNKDIYNCVPAKGLDGLKRSENHKAIKHSRKKKKSECEMHKLFETSGLFVIISSLPYQPDCDERRAERSHTILQQV